MRAATPSTVLRDALRSVPVVETTEQDHDLVALTCTDSKAYTVCTSPKIVYRCRIRTAAAVIGHAYSRQCGKQHMQTMDIGEVNHDLDFETCFQTHGEVDLEYSHAAGQRCDQFGGYTWTYG